jgi:hypothetical protein
MTKVERTIEMERYPNVNVLRSSLGILKKLRCSSSHTTISQFSDDALKFGFGPDPASIK